MRTHVDLFSGIGGFALAARWAGVETIAFAEIDPYATRVLQRHWPNVRNYEDVRNVPTVSTWLLTGGVPCQPASVAGKRRGAEDDRWLWPEALAAVERIRPAWVLFENPTGILSLNDGVEFERICAALEGQGYEVQSLVIPACGVGALHRRNRVWIIANSQRERRREPRDASSIWNAKEVAVLRQGVADTNRTGPQGRNGAELRKRAGEQPVGASGASVAYAAESGLSNGNRKRNQPTGQRASKLERSREDVSDSDTLNNGSYRAGANAPEPSGNEPNDGLLIGNDTWAVEPNVGRVANGIPRRVDRLRGLGNAIVPQVAYQLIKRMIEVEENQP